MEIKYNFLQLSESPKSWQADIFVRGRKLNHPLADILNLLQGMWDCSERKLSAKLGISRTLIRKLRNKEETHPVRISLVKDLLEELPENQKEALSNKINYGVEEVSTYQSSQWVKIPKTLTPRLAEVLGRHAGDGSIRKRTYTISLVSGSEKYSDVCIKDFRKLFGVEPKIYRDGKTTEIKINSLPLVLVFNRYYGMPSGKKSDTIREPELVKCDKRFRTAFLRGIVDTDGSVFLNKQSKPVMEIYSNSKQLLKDCREIIYLCGFDSKIRTKKLNEKQTYILRVSVKDTPRLLDLIKPKIKVAPCWTL